MNILKKSLTVLLLLLLILVGIGFVLPSEFRVQRDIVIEATPQQVYARLEDLRKWQDWGVWFKRDPDMQLRYEGPDSGIGMRSVWQSDAEGSGQMEIIAAEPNKRLVYSLYFPEYEMGSTGEFILTEQDGGTKVTWQDYGDVGPNPFMHYMALMMDSMIGPDFETGLENLKTLVESGQ
ncbi:SRPBCC family protein [Lacimicrobium alkaliphilum]|uniref:Polyketide cyclase n=1 Tax=Lacimicrobium alkaliphilum TaxID=1526571 RepID=A0ABQ1RF85_9ALTE|nr:SRPBCC family protein [Lacimicrobium alkaliphilum]GGD68536.1 polyketide cyclase [Lacimicrobium alkaliphilum]